MYNTTIVFKSISKSDEGTYECEATNFENEKQNYSLFVKVTGKTF